MTWKIFDVTVDGFPPVVFTAANRSKALAQAWRQYGHVDDRITLVDFRKIARARVRKEPPRPDGYDSVRRQYMVDPKIGGRVRLAHEGPMTGREGTVIYPGTSTCYVHVVLDGAEHSSVVHPMNVEFIGRAEKAAA